MRLLTLYYLIVILFFISLQCGHCQKGKNKCKRFKLDNGKVKVKSRGRLARLKCKKGFTMIDGDQFLSCVRQKWTGSLPKCIKSGCDVIHEIAHGEAFALFQGALMQFTCSPGYALNGSPSLACDGNSWNASIPYCGHATAHEDVELRCDFEDAGLCNWEILNDPPNKGWKRGQGGWTMRLPGSSAPSADHSTGTQTGNFLFADSTNVGTQALVFSPVFTPPTEAPACFILYYHIMNHATNGIRISFKPENISLDNCNTSIELRGDSGLARDDGWTMYYFDLNPYIILEQHFQIILEVLSGEGYNSDIAVDDVALAGGSQCIEYELEYEEQQNPPTTFIKKTTTSLIATDDTTKNNTTEQGEGDSIYTTITDDSMDITSITSTIGLQNEDLVSQLTAENIQDQNTKSTTITTSNIADIKLTEDISYQNTQTTSSFISIKNTTDNFTTKIHTDNITFGPKITIMPITVPQVITILPPTTSTPLKQRTPKSTVHTEIDTTLFPISNPIKQNNTTNQIKFNGMSTKPFISTGLTSLKYSSTFSSTDIMSILTSQPPSQTAFTPPPPPHLPPHPFSDTPTTTVIPYRTTKSSSEHNNTIFTVPSTDIHRVTKMPTSSIYSSNTFPAEITRSSSTTPKKFTPPPPPPLPPHPFSEMTTTTILTTKVPETTSTENNNPISIASTTLSNIIQTTEASMNNKTHHSFPVTSAMFSQSSFFTDTTTHATSTFPTTEISSKPTTDTVTATTISITTEQHSSTPKGKILTHWTTAKTTTNDSLPMETSTISTKSTLIHTIKAISTDDVTTSKPEITTSNIGKTVSPNLKNKTNKYSKGAIAAIAVLILVLCILGIIAISVAVDKYKNYTKEDKLLEDSEGSNSSIRFSYRREGGNREGGGLGGGGGAGEGRHGEIRIPAANFYGYENSGTRV